MSAPDPAADLVAQIVAQGAITLTDGSVFTPGVTNVFKGPVRPARTEVQAFSVFVATLAGPRPDQYFTQPAQTSFKHYLCQLTVRSNPGNYLDADELARVLLRATARQTFAGYLTTYAAQAAPEYFYEDDQRQHHFRFTIELWGQD